ncbi:MAG: mechanosensitive ion channel [bacterium]|nr:mechanosensitive ion channel [bacterium]
MIRAILIWRLRRLTEKKPHQRPTLETILELIKRVRPLFFFILAVFLGTQFLALSNEDRDFVSMIMMVALTLQAALMASYFIKQWIWQYLLRKSKRDETSMSALSIFNFISQIIVWSVAVIVVLQNMGQNVTGLVTGLGIGGIAVALAVQQILGDLFGSLSIVLDKPFVHGDFIIFDTFMGTVEKIGIKTTRIRSLTGEQIICSNSDLLNARIRNFKRMQERRVVFAVGVTYQTPADRLEQIPVVLKEVIEARENTRFDRAHFKGFGASSLDFEIVYYVLSPDYNIYMDIQQKINLIIFKRFADMGVEFAYPTQTLHVESAPPFDVRGTVTGPVTLMQDSPNDDTPRTSENAE